jgi:hypothetical protein
MPHKWFQFALVTAVVAVVALGAAASTTSAGTTAASARGASANGVQQIGNMIVTLKINKFVRRGKSLFAQGTAVSHFAPSPANPAGVAPTTVTKPFTAKVQGLRQFQSAQRICPVLELTLGPLDLNVLGLIVHLDTVHLTITANSRGGVLGSLFCSLAHARLGLAAKAKRLTAVARTSGLNTKGVTMGVPLFQQTTAGSSGNAKSPLMICPVLDLAVGPLDLNLLGLMVHLDRVHLVITADSTGGILGSLLCSLAGGAPAGT